MLLRGAIDFKLEFNLDENLYIQEHEVHHAGVVPPYMFFIGDIFQKPGSNILSKLGLGVQLVG